MIRHRISGKALEMLSPTAIPHWQIEVFHKKKKTSGNIAGYVIVTGCLSTMVARPSPYRRMFPILKILRLPWRLQIVMDFPQFTQVAICARLLSIHRHMRHCLDEATYELAESEGQRERAFGSCNLMYLLPLFFIDTSLICCESISHSRRFSYSARATRVYLLARSHYNQEMRDYGQRVYHAITRIKGEKSA